MNKKRGDEQLQQRRTCGDGCACSEKQKTVGNPDPWRRYSIKRGLLPSDTKKIRRATIEANSTETAMTPHRRPPCMAMDLLSRFLTQFPQSKGLTVRETFDKQHEEAMILSATLGEWFLLGVDGVSVNGGRT
jgi:hypothetical protein